MSAQRCFTAWKPRDRPAELLALLGVLDGELRRHLRDAEQLRRDQHRALARRRAASAGPPTRSPRGQRAHAVHAASADRAGVATGCAARARGSRRSTPSGEQHEQRVERVAGARRGSARSSARIRSRPPTTTSPEAAPGTRPAARCVHASGPGARRRPSSANTTTASALPSPTPPSLSGSRKREHADLGELLPERGVEAAALREIVERLAGQAPVAEGAHALAERLLVLAEPEVHAS